MADRVGQQFGNYRLARLLGRGAFAEVYLGEHIHLGTQAAIKLLHTQLDSDDLEQFRTEARTIARLVDPHIVRVFDFGVEGSTPFLVMDYAPNGTLRQSLPKGVPLPLSTVVSYVKQIAGALQYAHDEKLIHRDVKPENMLLGRRNEVLLSDFGIAVVAHSTHSQKMEAAVGTVDYMAPEQIMEKPVPASDQYALGIVVYEWLCGVRPFQGSSRELYGKHLYAPPPPLREKVPAISPMVESVVMKALAKDPQQRFARVEAFATALEDASLSAQSSSFASPSQPLEASSPSQWIQTSNTDLPPSQWAQPTIAAPHPNQQAQPTTDAPPPPSQWAQPTAATPPEAAPTRRTEEARQRRGVEEQAHQVGEKHLYENERATHGPLPINTAEARSGIHRTPHLPAGRLARQIILLIGLLLLVIGGSTSFFIIRNNQMASNNAHATVTAQATISARLAATAQAHATADAIGLHNPYSGKLALDDPMKDNSKGYDWLVTSGIYGDVGFSGGAYHIRATKVGYVDDCPARNLDFSNFTFQIEMTIIEGDYGGIVFRQSDANSGQEYYLQIGRDGFYGFFIEITDPSSASTLKTGYTTAIKTGLNQSNIVAVVAYNDFFYVYINRKFITSLEDKTFSHGSIGAAASSANTPAEVVFRNAKVWTF